MKLVFFGNASPKIAAIRYRVIKFAEMLEAEGHRCVVCLPSSFALQDRLYDNRSRLSKLLYLFLVLCRRIAQLRHVPGADVVYFRGPMFPYGPPLLEYAVAALNPRIVFDIDDAIWEPPAHVDSPFASLIDHGWVRKLARRCRYAVVGNAYLAEYVGQYTQNISIIPTCIDMDRHTAKVYPDPGGSAVVLGWTGLKDNLGYLALIEEVLQALARKYPIRLLVATGRPYELAGVEVENHPWVIEHEIDYLQRADIGLMPLHDTPRARGKCAFKALQYMAVGTPCVVSPVGMNAEVIEDGVNGYLAEDAETWRAKLESLIQDAALRRRMGDAARKTVREKYAHEANYPEMRRVMMAAGGKESERGA